MTTPRVYLPIHLTAGETAQLDDRARHHIINVLRLQMGDNIIVFNGKGGEFTATLLGAGKKVEIQLGQFNSVTRESPLHTHLYQGVSRGERMDYTVQKAAELGVTEITPVFTARTVVKIPQNKIEKRIEHWQGIAISACEQSGRTLIPTIHHPIDIKTFLAQFTAAATHGNYVFDMEATIDFKTSLECSNASAFNFIIGPEGGLDETEIMNAVTAGFTNARLGPRIFRTETASSVVLALLQYSKGDFSKL